MDNKRVRIRPQSGDVSTNRKSELSAELFRLGVKHSKIIPTKDTFIVICLNEENVDKLICHNSTEVLKSKNFEVNIPPHLRAKKTVVIKGLDTEVNKIAEADLIRDVEYKNEWAKIEEVYKFRNMPHLLKIRFTDIKMAKKATEIGLSIHTYHLRPDQIQIEDFIQLTPCYICYKYEHFTKDCPQKDDDKDKQPKYCSECAASGHTYRECTNKQNPKCLNCDGNHRTLAPICPIRKNKIKEIRAERKDKQKKFEHENKTYCAVTKLSQQIPALKQPESPTLHLHSDMSFKAMVIIIHAHLANIANPGTFGATVKNLLKQNNLPHVNLPDNAPSSEIFKSVSGFPGNDLNVLLPEQNNKINEMDSDSSNADVNVEDSEESDQANEKDNNMEVSEPESDESEHTQTIKKTPGRKIGLELVAASNDNIPEQLTPQELIRSITNGRVKYTYSNRHFSDETILKYIEEGKLTTNKHPIRKIELSSFKKIRSGAAKSPGDSQRVQARTRRTQ